MSYGPWTNGMQIALLSHRRVHGANHQDRLIDQACEEAAELITEMLHYRRGRSVALDIADEYADLWLCMEFLRRTLGISDERFKKNLDDRSNGLQVRLATLENQAFRAVTISEAKP